MVLQVAHLVRVVLLQLVGGSFDLFVNGPRFHQIVFHLILYRLRRHCLGLPVASSRSQLLVDHSLWQNARLPYCLLDRAQQSPAGGVLAGLQVLHEPSVGEVYQLHLGLPIGRQHCHSQEL